MPSLLSHRFAGVKVGLLLSKAMLSVRVCKTSEA